MPLNMNITNQGDSRAKTLRPPLNRDVARPVANLGNTCYMNTVLQALAHAPELCMAMYVDPHHVTCPVYMENAQKRRSSPSSSPDAEVYIVKPTGTSTVVYSQVNTFWWENHLQPPAATSSSARLLRISQTWEKQFLRAIKIRDPQTLEQIVLQGLLRHVCTRFLHDQRSTKSSTVVERWSSGNQNSAPAFKFRRFWCFFFSTTTSDAAKH
jgi:hypothetical protein